MGASGYCNAHAFSHSLPDAHSHTDITPAANGDVYRHALPFTDGDSHSNIDSHADFH